MPLRRPRSVRAACLTSTVALTIGVVAALGLASCADGASVIEPAAPDERGVVMSVAPLPALIEEPHPLAVPTYDGSGESVHPDVVLFPAPWHGFQYWLTMTPYARSDSKLENPSILVSADGERYEVPDSLTNPVVPHSGGKKDYNSDPELVYDAALDRLVLFYRFVGKNTNTILAATSRDGRSWTKEPKVFSVPGHTAVSPTVTPATAGQAPRMWYVNAGRKGCFTSATRVMMRTSLDPEGRLTGGKWSSPVPTDLAQPGYTIWHIKVRYVPSHQEYWAVYAAFPPAPDGCNVDDLFFARSRDGVRWESFPEPMLRHQDRAWTATAVYRSSFLYDAASDELQVWLSARGDDRKWRLGRARFRYSRLITELSDSVMAAPPTVLGAGAPLPWAASAGDAP